MIIKQIKNGKSVKAKISDELQAVITAAVQAMMQSNSCKLNVKPFRRGNATVPVWSMVSRKEQIDSRKMI